MSKEEQIKRQSKEIRAKVTPEKLLKLHEQSQQMQKKINPLGSLFKSPFADFAKSPLLEYTADITKIFDNLNFNNWSEKVLGIRAIYPKTDYLKIDFPKFDFFKNSPLYEYGLHLQKIGIQFNTPEIVKSFQTIRDFAEMLEAEKLEAENNYWYALTIEEHEFEQSKNKDKITELEQLITELEHRIKDNIITIKVLAGQISQSQTKTPQNYANNLKPNITVSQIARLYESLIGIFEATPEQWRALFSETEIKLIEPIKANAITDIVVLFHYLKEREFVGTSKYPSILERVKAFAINGKTVTAKQINKPKSENYNFPLIGKNYDNISKTVANL